MYLPADAWRRLEGLAEGTRWGEPEADDRFLRAGLEELMRWLESPLGFIHELEAGTSDEGPRVVRAIWPAAVMARCGLEPDTMAGTLAEAGVWADAARRRCPVIHNDYPHMSRRSSVPAGHIPLTRELVVPVERAGRVEIAVGVGNRATPYTPQDAGLLQSLASALWYVRERALGDWNTQRLLRSEQVVSSATHAALVEGDGAGGFLEAVGALREGLEARVVVLGRVTPSGRVRLELVSTEEGGRHLRPPITLGVDGPHQAAVDDGQVVLANDLSGSPGAYAGVCEAASLAPDEPLRRALFAPIRLPDTAGDAIGGEAGDGAGDTSDDTTGGAAGDMIWGVVGALDGPRPWDAADAVLARRVADVLALAAGRQREQAHSARADARLRTVFEHIADGIAVVEPQTGRMVLVNPALAKILGVPQRALQGLSVGDFLGRLSRPPREDLILADMRRVLDGETVSRQGVPMPRPDGEVKRVDLTGAVIPWGAGQAVMALMRDVTELHQVRVRAAQEDRLASLGTLAAGVAHEINNPLTYILSTLDAVTRAARRWNEPTLERDARDSLRGAQQIARLARGLLAFGRAQDDEPGLVDLRAPLEHALTLAHNTLKHRGHIATSLQEVPPVLAVEGQVAQVALNLLVNAAHAIPEDAPALDHEVRLELWAEGDQVCFAVEDTGTGIAPGLLHRIFDPFFTTKERGEGSGLGLSISRDLITGMGGTISAESPTARGREAIAAGWGLAGSRFTVRLPAAPKEARALGRRHVGPTPVPAETDEPCWDEAPVAAPSSAAPTSGSPSAGRSPRPSREGRRTLLLVDDSEALLRSIGRLLSLTYDVTTATSGEEALEILMERTQDPAESPEAPFDLVLCDIKMPGILGTAVHRALRDELPAQARRFALMTGGSDSHDVEAYVNEHTIPRLHKPFDLNTLDSRLEELITAIEEPPETDILSSP